MCSQETSCYWIWRRLIIVVSYLFYLLLVQGMFVLILKTAQMFICSTDATLLRIKNTCWSVCCGSANKKNVEKVESTISMGFSCCRVQFCSSILINWLAIYVFEHRIEVLRFAWVSFVACSQWIMQNADSNFN